MISKAIYQIITDEILDSIKSGILKPGDNIPSIRDIKEKYKVSSITALRVFKELTNGGYIIRKHGSGYFVAEKNLPTKALMLICGIHPPVDFNDYDNWGNRINAGIVQECLESRMGLYYPAAIGVLRNGSVAHNGAEVLGASIAESVSTAGGVLIDWRFTDKEIEKYIIPAAGKVPLVLIGRRSRLPIITVSLPEREGGITAAKLALKVGYERFIVCQHVISGQLDECCCNAFQEELRQSGVDEGNIIFLDNAFMGPERDMQILSVIENELRNKSKRIFIFTSAGGIGRFIADQLTLKNIVMGHDVGLISFLGLESSYVRRPYVSSIVVSGEQMGRLAVYALLEYNRTAKREYIADISKIDLNDTFLNNESDFKIMK